MHASTFPLHSPQTGTEYRIQVLVPQAGEAGAEGAVSVMLFLDGDDQFRFAVEAYRAARAAGEVPALLLAGVGYGASYTKLGNKRVRDYTPTAVATESESGGAEAFVTFLEATLWPELARRHRVREDLRGIGGHSLGSLLVLHALFRKEPFFHRFLASAPSIWWDDRSVLGTVARRQQEGGDLNARVFLSVGAKDSHSMTGDLALLEKQLADKPLAELEVVSRRFSGRDHFNVLPDAFRAGLSALWRDGAK